VPSPIPVWIVAAPSGEPFDYVTAFGDLSNQVNLGIGVLIVVGLLAVFSLGVLAALTMRRPG